MPLFGPAPTYPPIAVGSFAISPYGAVGATAWANSAAKFSCVLLPGGSWDQLATEVTVAGSSDSQYRLALYTDTGFGKPGALVVDGGLVSSTAAGAAVATVSVATSPGLYWMAAVSQNATSPATVRYNGCSADSFTGHNAGFTALNLPQGGWTGTVSGAFPATAPTVSSEANPTIMGIRRKS